MQPTARLALGGQPFASHVVRVGVAEAPPPAGRNFGEYRSRFIAGQTPSVNAAQGADRSHRSGTLPGIAAVVLLPVG
jgi:hypothetical protein